MLPPERSNPFQCDHVGCDALRRAVNNWYVVISDEAGVHVYHWDTAPVDGMHNGDRYHFCGLSHTINFVSKRLTPDTPANPARESTLELKPPLTREGKATE